MNDEWKAKGKGKGEKIKPGDTADGVKVKTPHASCSMKGHVRESVLSHLIPFYLSIHNCNCNCKTCPWSMQGTKLFPLNFYY